MRRMTLPILMFVVVFGWLRLAGSTPTVEAQPYPGPTPATATTTASPVVTVIVTLVPPTATQTQTATPVPPTPTLTPVPVPVDPVGQPMVFCPSINGMSQVAQDAARAAWAKYRETGGYGQLCNPNVPYNPVFNRYRNTLVLRNPNVPYNPMSNGFRFTCGCTGGGARRGGDDRGAGDRPFVVGTRTGVTMQ